MNMASAVKPQPQWVTLWFIDKHAAFQPTAHFHVGFGYVGGAEQKGHPNALRAALSGKLLQRSAKLKGSAQSGSLFRGGHSRAPVSCGAIEQRAGLQSNYRSVSLILD